MYLTVSRAGWIVAGALALALIASFAAEVRGGPLDPPGSPASTGRPIDELQGAWSRRLNSANGSAGPFPPVGCNSDRFKCVMSTGAPFAIPAAVLDMETGLVWQRNPDDATMTWYLAKLICHEAETGARRGWRLPTIDELNALADADAVSPALPSGHPFVSPFGLYWTSTEDNFDDGSAWAVSVAGSATNISEGKSDPALAWCVRGPGNGPTAN